MNTFADHAALQVGRRSWISKSLQSLSSDISTTSDVEILQVRAMFRHQSEGAVVEIGVFEVCMF